MKTQATVFVPEPLWRNAVTMAINSGHDLDRDVLAPALLEYVKVQAQTRGRDLGRCSACNATTLDGECLECGWVAKQKLTATLR